MTETQTLTSLFVIGRRWFQRSYGNTYHTAEVIANGQNIGKTGPAYGYSDAYLQTACDVLRAAGYLPEDGPMAGGGLSRYCREKEIDYAYTVTDVQRERDL